MPQSQTTSNHQDIIELLNSQELYKYTRFLSSLERNGNKQEYVQKAKEIWEIKLKDWERHETEQGIFLYNNKTKERITCTNRDKIWLL